jgi:GTP-binding protein EngB required for normal cell division
MTEETQQFVRKEIRSEFTQLQKEQDVKWNEFRSEILEKIQPQFTSAQLTGFLITLLALMVGAVIYVESIKQQSQNNKEMFEKYERDKQLETSLIFTKMDKIYDLALETNKAVAVLENSNQIEKNKQKVRDWGNK